MENRHYDFDTRVERRGTCSYKWDSAQAEDGILPLWVADMDFRTAPPVVDALRERVAHGIFGYTRVPDEYYAAVTGWFSRMHGWDFTRDHIIYTSGVVPAISAIIKALTRPGDKVLVQTPVYNCFFSSIRNNGCSLAENPLVRDGDTYRMDFDGLEAMAADPAVKLMLLCNPHNPAGRVWTREELQRVADICRRNSVTPVSDEIHCELAFAPHTYVPFATVSDWTRTHCITCVSPSKAFNMAGLQIANIVAADAEVRRKVDRAINDNEVCDVNPFGVCATIAAYNEGAGWLAELKDYLWGNYLFMKDFCGRRLADFPLCRLEGTYLVWMDCRSLGLASDALEHELKKEARLWLNSGTMYGREGEGYMRWNIACPRTVLAEALQRFLSYTDGKR